MKDLKGTNQGNKIYVSWTTVHVGVVFLCQLNNISIKDICGIIVVYVSLGIFGTIAPLLNVKSNWERVFI
jgi:hypothetical protein